MDDLPLHHVASLSIVKFNKIGKTTMRKIGFAEKEHFPIIVSVNRIDLMKLVQQVKYSNHGQLKQKNIFQCKSWCVYRDKMYWCITSQPRAGRNKQ